MGNIFYIFIYVIIQHRAMRHLDKQWWFLSQILSGLKLYSDGSGRQRKVVGPVPWAMIYSTMSHDLFSLLPSSNLQWPCCLERSQGGLPMWAFIANMPIGKCSDWIIIFICFFCFGVFTESIAIFFYFVQITKLNFLWS